MKKNYETNNLDEAAYFVLKGLRGQFDSHTNVSATFSFPDNDRLERLRKEFWGGTSKVDLKSWIMTRQGIKNILKAKYQMMNAGVNKEKPEKPEVIEGTKVWIPQQGDNYFYVIERNPDGTNKVSSALFGKANMLHLARQQKGNFFKTREEAEASDLQL